jgi:hypothetical protein
MGAWRASGHLCAWRDRTAGADWIIQNQDEQFTEQSWLRLPPSTGFAGTAGPSGCRAWVKSGHLAAVHHGPISKLD